MARARLRRRRARDHAGPRGQWSAGPGATGRPSSSSSCLPAASRPCGPCAASSALPSQVPFSCLHPAFGNVPTVHSAAAGSLNCKAGAKRAAYVRNAVCGEFRGVAVPIRRPGQGLRAISGPKARSVSEVRARFVRRLRARSTTPASGRCPARRWRTIGPSAWDLLLGPTGRSLAARRRGGRCPAGRKRSWTRRNSHRATRRPDVPAPLNEKNTGQDPPRSGTPGWNRWSGDDVRPPHQTAPRDLVSVIMPKRDKEPGGNPSC